MTWPHVSVVIPAYNHAGWLEAAIAGVRTQTLAPVEIVVVDDGSTDCTAEVLEALAAPDLRVVHQENQGAHAALNRAVALASGRWIAILNSDDRFSPQRLEEAWGVTRATGALLVLGQVALVDERDTPLASQHPVARWYAQALAEAVAGPSLASSLAQHNAAVTTSNFFMHRELWRTLRGFRAYRYVHDLDFLLRAIALVPGKIILEPSLGGVVYRVHPDNTIREDEARALAERSAMLKTHHGLLPRVDRAWGRIRWATALKKATRELGTSDHAVSGLPPGNNPEPPLRCGLVVARLHAGGVEEVVAMLATGLPNHGFGTYVLCTEEGGAVAQELQRRGVPVTVARDPAGIRRWLQRVRPHIVSTHVVSAEVMETLTGHGVPAVETVHNTYAWFNESEWFGEGKKARQAKALVAVSETVAAYYRKRVAAPPPIHVVPNGVAPGRVSGVPRPFARRALGLSEDAPVFVHLGRFVPEKNQIGVVGAFRGLAHKYPQLTLLVAGPGHTSAYAQEVRREAHGLLEAGKVRILPPQENVGVILSAADVFVSHSWFEGWSLAATEALWLGSPVVLSHVGGSPELVGEGGDRGRLVPNPLGNPLALDADVLVQARESGGRRHEDALQLALEEMLQELEFWRGEREVIRQHARTHWSSQEMVRRYALVLRPLCDSP
ncbi:MAG: glycosyltransferase [Gemmatimonadota bacterium]